MILTNQIKYKGFTMEQMKYFMDTHDKEKGTFPEGLSQEQLGEFFKNYEAACKQEGVISIKTHVGLKDGKAFCLNMAPSAEAVYRVHEKVGLPFDSITEIQTISPADIIKVK